MPKVIVYLRSDGGASVCYPLVSKSDPAGFTEDDALARAMAKDIPIGASQVHVIDSAELPSRDFRDAWSTDGTRVQVDMPKARAIHMARIRLSRDKALDALDKDFMRALGQKKQKEADDVEIKRQKLRDIPQAFDLTQAKTPEELKALWPAELPKD